MRSSSNFHIDGTTVNKDSVLQSQIQYCGIYVIYGYSIVINNTISMYNQFGIRFDHVNASQIENTIASNNMNIGMGLLDSININISTNTVSHNAYGLHISSSTNIHIDGITINDNTYDGIYLLQTKWIYISRFTTLNKYSVSNYTHFFTIQDSQYISIYDTIITVNTSVVSSGELFSQPAVITLNNSTLNLSRCTFMGNTVTGIKAIPSSITLSGNLTFSNNSAYTGSAFILVDNSIVILTENCRVHFINNHATNTGGVFSLSNTQKLKTIYLCNYDHSYCSVSVIPTSTCFLRTQMDSSSIQNFIFSNNSAGKGGDIVYGGHVAYGFNNDKNCMDTFKDISNIYIRNKFIFNIL